MKSKMKKVVSLVLAMAMVLTMSMTAFAAEQTYTITINNESTGHTYQAYQIFSGTLSDGKLTGIEWGSGVSVSDALYEKLAEIADTSGTDTTYPFKNLSTAEAVADALSAYTDDSAVAEAFADVISGYLSSTYASTDEFIAASGTEGETNYVAAHYSITGLTAGYYFVKDKDNSLSGKDNAYTDYILWLTSSVSVNSKSSSPSVTKKVKETNDSVANSTTDWQDAADYDIGDVIPYQLTGTMPSTLDDYTVYKYEFTDTLSKGLTVVTTNATIATTDVTVTVVTGTTSTVVNTSKYSVSLTDYTGSESTYTGGHVLTVSFDDVLTLTDASGSAISVTSASKIVVDYNAKLNDDAVIGSAGNPNEVYLTYSNNPNDTTGGEKGQTPVDKVTVFTFVLDVNKVDQDNVALPGAGFTLYKYNATSGTYEAVGSEVTGTSLTKFEFSGLDSGLYMVKETTTPSGYNTVSPIYFEIAATYETDSTDPVLKTLNVYQSSSTNTGSTSTVDSDFTVASDLSSISTDVMNKKGSVLPSTGGIGTTIFYIVGAILVLGAGVVLVTRRRTAR